AGSTIEKSGGKAAMTRPSGRLRPHYEATWAPLQWRDDRRASSTCSPLSVKERPLPPEAITAIGPKQQKRLARPFQYLRLLECPCFFITRMLQRRYRGQRTAVGRYRSGDWHAHQYSGGRGANLQARAGRRFPPAHSWGSHRIQARTGPTICRDAACLGV